MNSFFFRNFGILLLRLFVGSMMLWHGFGKIQIILSGNSSEWLNPLGIGSSVSLWLSMCAETVCSILIILGIFTRVASTILAFNMAIAAFVFLGNSPWSQQELAVLYFGIYVCFIVMGSGEYSLSNLAFKKRSKDSISKKLLD